MATNERLYPLLERWVAEADTGLFLPVADLCRDCPDLLPEAERQISVLRQFHLLARPDATTGVELQAKVDTASGTPPCDHPPGTLPGPGSRFGRYQILAELGSGGMGIVCLARDTQLDRDVALKLMRPELAANPRTADRFLREARALAAVRHDHVVEVYDYGEIDGARFVAMPLLAGETLDARLKKQSPLPPAEVVRIGMELASGLAAVHARGLIHRDLKPSNVWLEAPNGRVKLLDFGLARDPGARDDLTSPGTILGTPAYMSPEQANGCGLDARSDLFSLGSLLYQAATGRSAFAGPTTTATLAAVGEKQPPPARTINPAVPPVLSDLIQQMHSKNPNNRPASAAQVERQLAIVADPTTVEYKPEESATERFPGKRRHGWSGRVRLAIAGALGLLLLAGGILIYSLTNPPRETGTFEQFAPAVATKPSEPLRIRTLDVHHLKGMGDNKTQPQGIFGKETFGASLDDSIKVTATLSRPAYCYLIVFRPDGEDKILYPQIDSEAPDRTEEPRYPSKFRKHEYGLDDGTGLWLVALVASDDPLPSYADWRRKHPGSPWTKSEGQADLIWLDDGNWLEAVLPGRPISRGSRGEKKSTTASPIVDVVDWLKAETGGTVKAVGFTVEKKQ